jgi:hypothetical protein
MNKCLLTLHYDTHAHDDDDAFEDDVLAHVQHDAPGEGEGEG